MNNMLKKKQVHFAGFNFAPPKPPTHGKLKGLINDPNDMTITGKPWKDLVLLVVSLAIVIFIIY